MAIYHLSMRIGSRSGGHSAAAKIDYVLRRGRYARGRPELAWSLSGNMPDWASEDPRLYWQAADDRERSNGRLFRELELISSNEAERGLRMGKLRQKISGGFRSMQGARDFANPRSVIATARKRRRNVLETLSRPHPIQPVPKPRC